MFKIYLYLMTFILVIATSTSNIAIASEFDLGDLEKAALGELGTRFSRIIQSTQKRKLAVFDFKNISTQKNQFGSRLSEYISADLALRSGFGLISPAVEIIPKTRVVQQARAKGWDFSTLSDEQAIEVARLVGADIAIVGAFELPACGPIEGLTKVLSVDTGGKLMGRAFRWPISKKNWAYTQQAEQSSPQSPRNSPQLVISQRTSDTANQFQLFLVRSDGTEQKQITQIDAGAAFPSWAPDGRSILFFSRDQTRIFSIGPDGGAPRLIVDASPSHTNESLNLDPAWSPDSQKLLISWGEFGKGRSIYVIDKDGRNERRLTTGNSDDNARWSPDGTRILFRRYASGMQIFVMNADGSNQSKLTTQGDNSYPVWSPDGRKIAFSSATSGGYYHIYVMNSDGSSLVRITDGARNDYVPVWSRDGQSILFFSQASGEEGAALYSMKVDGSNQIRLSNNEFRSWPLSLSPAGPEIAAISWSRIASMDYLEYDVVQIDGGGGCTRISTDAYWGPIQQAWRPLL